MILYYLILNCINLPHKYHKKKRNFPNNKVLLYNILFVETKKEKKKLFARIVEFFIGVYVLFSIEEFTGPLQIQQHNPSFTEFWSTT